MLRRPSVHVDVLLLVLVHVLVLGLWGCGAKPYWVRPSHLARAQGVEDAAIPALDPHAQPTFLYVDAITEVFPTDPRTGLAVANARKPGLGYRIAGPILAGVGVLLVATPKEGDGTGEAIAGASLLGLGVALTIYGFVAGGREADEPSPGFPRTVAEP